MLCWGMALMTDMQTAFRSYVCSNKWNKTRENLDSCLMAAHFLIISMLLKCFFPPRSPPANAQAWLRTSPRQETPSCRLHGWGQLAFGERREFSCLGTGYVLPLAFHTREWDWSGLSDWLRHVQVGPVAPQAVAEAELSQFKSIMGNPVLSYGYVTLCVTHILSLERGGCLQRKIQRTCIKCLRVNNSTTVSSHLHEGMWALIALEILTMQELQQLLQQLQHL